MTDVATWSQLFSSIAVLGTLIYLAVEIRQNTAAEHAATRLGINNSSAAELFKMVDYPDIAICLANGDSVTLEQAMRLSAWLGAAMRHFEYTWLQHKSRLAEGYYREADAQIIRTVIGGSPRARSWWDELGRHLYGAGFVEEVDGLLKDQPHATDFYANQLAWAARKMAA